MFDATGRALGSGRVLALERPHPIRIGIDGFCAAGKTTLANALGLELSARGRSVIRACGDDFQNTPVIRYQLGDRSPEGFYRHAMNFAALRSELLDLLGPTGTLAYSGRRAHRRGGLASG
jgi:uridine kinase